jgi:3-oxoacyl-[acyl-carrier protein] reductase
MNLQLADHVAFVAGSSRGIGRAIASALLDEGARVVLSGRDAQALERTAMELAATHGGARILAIPGDLTVPDHAHSALAQTVKYFDRLDHLIANLGTGAGTQGPTPPADDWERLFRQNFFGSVRLTEAGLPHLRANSGGSSILYISSIVALEASWAPLPYGAAKAALTNYSKNLSRHLAAEGIRVNTIAPGNILFPGGRWESRLSARPTETETMLAREVPQQRFGTPAEIASLAAWLCSPLAAFATGGAYVVDGGQTRCI